MRKIRTLHHKHPDAHIFIKMVMLIGFAAGLIIPILPNFVRSIVDTEFAVSAFYAFMALLMFLGALSSTVIFSKVERTTITKLSLFISGIIFFLLTFVVKVLELTILETIRGWFNLFLLMALALFVRDFAQAKNLGEEEGLYYRYDAMGLLFGYLIGGFFASIFGYELLFILAAITIFATLGWFYHLHIIQEHPAILNRKKVSTNKLWQNIKTYFKSKPLAKIYFVTLLFMTWVGFKRLYIPLYVIMSGYLDSASGAILALSMLPLIFLERRVGRYADTKGVHMPITWGFLIMGSVLFIVFLSPFTFFNFLLLALVNIGGAFIEPLQEYYLFKKMPPKEEDELYGIYMTADPIAYLLTPLIGMVVLFFLPFKFLFLAFALLMFASAGFSYTKLRNS